VPFAGFNDASRLRYPQQATFHPLKYLTGLASAIGGRGGKLFAKSAVVKVEERDASVSVTSQAGVHVKAAQAIIATNSPINDQVAIHSKLAPHRTYSMAFTFRRGSIDDALYWDTADRMLQSIQERYLSAGRNHEDINVAKLLCGMIKEHIALLEGIAPGAASRVN
jgi:glycine/D-amino acid oxidase-like deaminating enzyme